MNYSNIPAFMENMFQEYKRIYTFASAPPPEVFMPSGVFSQDPWIAVAATLEQAKHGNRQSVNRLLHLSSSSSSPMLGRACLDLLGDAGDHAAMESLAEAILAETDDELLLDLCRAAMWAGVLWLVPYMLEAWVQVKKPDTRSTISSMISSLIGVDSVEFFTEDRDYPAQDYRDLVSLRINELHAVIGSDQKPIWGGALFGVKSLAIHMRNLLAHTEEARIYLLSSKVLRLRHKFEASTGIDCSSFYKELRFQPLAAASIIESFLEGPDVAKYEEGVRYFFGHKIET
ncbi:hypothetical protein [Pseudomonas farris]